METLRFKEAKKVYAMFFTALVIFIISGIVVFRELNDRVKTSQMVVHTYKVINKVNEVYLNFIEAERQFQRGFYNHDSKTMALYHETIKTTRRKLAEVKQLTTGTLGQQVRVNNADVMINQLSNTINQALNNIDKLHSSADLDENEHMINKIKLLINAVNAEELSLLKVRSEQLEHVKNIKDLEILVSVCLGCLFLIFSFLSIVRLDKMNELQQLQKQQLEYEKSQLSETQRFELEFGLNAAKLGFWNLNLNTFKVERSLLYDQIFGYVSMLPEWTTDMFIAHVHPDDQPRVVLSFKNAKKNNSPWEVECRIYRMDDNSLHWIWISGKIFQVGEERHMLGVIQDITDRKLMENMLSESEERWKFALENAHHGVWDWYIPEKIIYFSHYWKSMLGYPDSEIKNEQYEFESRIHPEDLERVWKNLNDHFEQKTSEYVCEARFLCKDGSYKWVLQRGKVISRALNGTVMRAIGTHTDISDLKETETHLKKLAEHDNLTGLVNRTIFEDRLKQAVLLSKRTKSNIAVLFVDIDGFKQINDMYGHAAGDLLLCAIAGRLQTCVRETDTCSRYGGDEFLVLLQDIRDDGIAIGIAQELIDQFSNPFLIEDKKLYVNLSIGISLYPKDGEELLIQKADKAMYYIKYHGKNNYKLYDDSLLFTKRDT